MEHASSTLEHQEHCSQHTVGFSQAGGRTAGGAAGPDTSAASAPGWGLAECSGLQALWLHLLVHSGCVAALEEEAAKKEQTQEEDTKTAGESCLDPAEDLGGSMGQRGCWL